MKRMPTIFITLAGLWLLAALPAQALVTPARAASTPTASTANAAAAAAAAVAPTPAPPKPGPPAVVKVDINNAGEADLMKALEINAADARLIIKKRPYQSALQLVERNALSFKKFKAIKDRVAVAAPKT